MSSNSEIEEVWNSFWKGIVTKKNGDIDLKQIKAELYDYKLLLDRIPAIYNYATGGILSKPFYNIDVMKAAIDDHINELVKQGIKDYQEEQDILARN